MFEIEAMTKYYSTSSKGVPARESRTEGKVGPATRLRKKKLDPPKIMFKQAFLPLPEQIWDLYVQYEPQWH